MPANEMLSGYVTVAFEGDEREVNYDRGATVERILMWSLIEHGLPTPAFKKFTLSTADGAVLRGSDYAQFAGVKPGDTLTLAYAGSDG